LIVLDIVFITAALSFFWKYRASKTADNARNAYDSGN